MLILILTMKGIAVGGQIRYAVSLPGWLASYTPDIVLLHIGHNDFFQSQSVASTIDDTEDIIDVLQDEQS